MSLKRPEDFAIYEDESEGPAAKLQKLESGFSDYGEYSPTDGHVDAIDTEVPIAIPGFEDDDADDEAAEACRREIVGECREPLAAIDGNREALVWLTEQYGSDFSCLDLGNVGPGADDSCEEEDAASKAFEVGFKSTIRIRQEQARNLPVPHPEDAFCTRAAKNLLLKLSVDQHWHVVKTSVSLQRRKILGRYQLGLDDIKSLPTVKEQEKGQVGLYTFAVAHPSKDYGLYVGSATGCGGFYGRWSTYDEAKRKHDGCPKAVKGAYMKDIVVHGASIHIRVIASFEQGTILRSQVQLLEGLFMDYMGTIARQQTWTFAKALEVRGNSTRIYHCQEMLQASEAAFPPQRILGDMRGLNIANALKQVQSLKSSVKECIIGHPCCQESLAILPGTLLQAGEDFKPVCHACYDNARLSKNLYMSAVEFDSWMLHRRSMRRVSPSQYPALFKCQAPCEYAVRSKDLLNTHQAICPVAISAAPFTVDENPYECQYCEERYPSPNALNYHYKVCEVLRNGQGPEKLHECQYCGKGFVLVGDANRHAHTCQKNPDGPQNELDLRASNACPHCKETFTSFNSMERHLKSCAKKPQGKAPMKDLECVHCHKVFGRQDTLNQHMETCKMALQGAKPARPWECTLCHKTFTQKAALTAHLKACEPAYYDKEPVKPFACSKCEKSFLLKHQAKRHEKTCKK